MLYRLLLKAFLLFGLLIHSVSQTYVLVQKSPQQGFVASYVTVLAVSAQPQIEIDWADNSVAIASANLLFLLVIFALVFLYRPPAIVYRSYLTPAIRAPPYSIVMSSNKQ